MFYSLIIINRNSRPNMKDMYFLFCNMIIIKRVIVLTPYVILFES